MLDHLKICRCGAPEGHYQCARCARTYCLACDHYAHAREIKTIVRYCQDWRCQRERRIEGGASLLRFVGHRDDCDWLQPMWHKGPCDCGLHDAMAELSAEELDALKTAGSRVVDGFRAWRHEENRRTADRGNS